MFAYSIYHDCLRTQPLFPTHRVLKNRQLIHTNTHNKVDAGCPRRVVCSACNAIRSQMADWLHFHTRDTPT